MLKLYIKDQSEINSSNLVYDVERVFGETDIPTIDLIKQVISDIDHSQMIDSYSFIDRFGYKLRISELSTGVKAAILAILMPNKIINFCEAGNNCRDWSILNITQGKLLIHYPSISINYSQKDLNRNIDVNIHGSNLRFKKVDRLVQYLRNEVSFIPMAYEIMEG